MKDLHDVLSTLNKEYIFVSECVNLCKRSACSERLRIFYGKYPGMRRISYELDVETAQGASRSSPYSLNIYLLTNLLTLVLNLDL